MSNEAEYINSMKSSGNNIMVAVRIRPMNERELASQSNPVISAIDSNLIVLFDPSLEKNTGEVPRNRSKEKNYAFDVVFREEATQNEVFEKSASFLIDGITKGYNASILAYGPTGAGKTYTMIGESNSPGLMSNTFNALFSLVESTSISFDYKVVISYLEIYNENIRDLLHPKKGSLEIREDRTKGITVSGLSEKLAMSRESVFQTIHLGNKKRSVEPTKANETSSRSHAVLQITVESRDKALGVEGEVTIGKLSLIDLAGSERAANTQNKGLRLLEGANINKSLLALGNCINALCELSEKGGKIYVPYRDSKLTRLLKDSLGGNCRTVMITCVSPNEKDYEDTFNTLVYANRAKNIKTKVQRNSLNVSFHISKYTNIITQLKQEVLNLRAQLNQASPQNSPKKSVVDKIITKPIFPGSSYQINRIKTKNSKPSQTYENYLIEINQHFQEEAKLRKNIYLTENSIDNIGFVLFAKQSELLDICLEQGENSDNADEIRKEIFSNMDQVKSQEYDLKILKEQLNLLVQKRQDFEIIWKNNKVPEPFIFQLHLELKKHSLLMNSLDFEGKDSHTHSVIEQKDLYIKLLEDQLKLRDSLLSHDLPKFDQNTLKQIKSYQQINTYFTPVHQSYVITPAKSRQSNENFLGQSKKSRLPSLRGSGSQQKIPRRDFSEARSYGNEGKYSIRYKKKYRTDSNDSQLSDSSGASTYADHRSKIFSIYEKYSNSPYVKGMNFNISPSQKG